MEHAIAEDRPEVTARTRTIMALGLLLAYVALGTLDVLTIIPPTVATYVVAGLLMACVVPAFNFGSKDWRENLPPIVFGSLAIGGFGCLLVAAVHYERPDLELNRDRYDHLAAELRKRPELVPLIRDARADGVITNGEKEAFDEAVSRFDRDKALGK